MNLALADTLLGRQRARQWFPLITQQLRLRHVHQIFGFNLPSLPKKSSYYFTLHLTTMSAPFYTSEKLDSSNPKWPELDQRSLQNLQATAVVLRIWQHFSEDGDSIVATWGVNFSGLVYLGNRIAEIQPAFFVSNTVIFCLRGGYFTSQNAINQNENVTPPFADNLNLLSGKIFRKTEVKSLPGEIRNSYNINKLRKLHSLQVTIKNKGLDVQHVKDRIELKSESGSLERQTLPETSSATSNIRYAPQLLTMNSLNKMLELKPTKLQKKEMVKLRNEIEVAQFRTKLLSQERDKKSAAIRRFKQKLRDLVDGNEEKSSDLMESYYRLSKETDKLKELKRSIGLHQEVFLTVHSQLFQRRKQLMQQLLFIYPIQQMSEKKYTINGIYLPNSDILSDCSDSGISVALGYVTHVLLMCSKFLQVPLRYPVTHYGSRSSITDNISNLLPDREKDFPLFTKGKDKIQFTYAVYLLNKNIAQLRWLFFMHTPELKATLPNLLSLLQCRDGKELTPLVTTLDTSVESEEVRDLAALRRTDRAELSKKYLKLYKSSECGPGLSEILAIPEAFMNKQISPDTFKTYGAMRHSDGIVIKEGREECENNGDDVTIEQGTDLLDPGVNLEDFGEERKNCNGRSEGEVNGGQMESPLTARTDALLNTKSFNLVRPKNSL